MPKSLFIKTYGCQMNVYDSDRMAETLAPLGYAPTDGPESADMVILNTCHIREKAAEKLFSELGRLRGLKTRRRQDGGDLVIAVAGCVAQAEGAEILRRAPHVDIVLGPQTYHRLPEMVARATRGAGAQLDTEFPVESKFDHLPAATGAAGVTAFLSVQEGCDKFCSFCVVPYTRGAEASRPVEAVLAEARGLVERGAREITLLGQNVNAYHGAGLDGEAKGEEWGLARLIGALARIEGLARIRYTTSHPADMDEALIAAHAEEEKLMPFLHLPVQSGSDRILAAMNRKHRAGDYLALVERLRGARPDLALSTDIIVGYPGESEADFAATLALIEAVGFAAAFSFKYSPRPGTPAALAQDQVPEPQKAERLARLQALFQRQMLAFNESMIGRRLPVLFEAPGRHAGQLKGRSPYLQPVHAEASESLIGCVAEVEIEGLGAASLRGRPVAVARAASARPAASLALGA
ncbi:MAG TPA: tRNA (N6-isopentenyl adenosine(37)-C2)-methylthiotransferase MiaB [Dongiaceae bacterium]|nr:tRNA (N6-isopentenyl adenosine(37)-C2)-methylthiotransferase MiaB [Dongiaceae bacterium]